MIKAVEARFQCNSVSVSGADSKFPMKQVQLGAIYTNDPESPNRSFARATPSGTLQLSIDPALPASEFFKHGHKYRITIEEIPFDPRTYIGDAYPVDGKPIIYVSRDGQQTARGQWSQAAGKFVVHDEENLSSNFTAAELQAAGLNFWMYDETKIAEAGV